MSKHAIICPFICMPSQIFWILRIDIQAFKSKYNELAPVGQWRWVVQQAVLHDNVPHAVKDSPCVQKLLARTHDAESLDISNYKGLLPLRTEHYQVRSIFTDTLRKVASHLEHNPTVKKDMYIMYKHLTIDPSNVKNPDRIGYSSFMYDILTKLDTIRSTFGIDNIPLLSYLIDRFVELDDAGIFSQITTNLFQ